MDAAGAELIRQRIEQHEHWKQAQAVQDGDQTRIYGLQERHEIVEGAHALTTYRVQKRIVGGHWERELIVENVQQVA